MKKQWQITEVWDYRLSNAQPIIYKGACDDLPKRADHNTWVVCIYDQGAAKNAPLAHFDTGIKVMGNHHNDDEAMEACYAWLKSVRDEYSRDAIEVLKPLVAGIRLADIARQAATDAYDEKLKEVLAMQENSE